MKTGSFRFGNFTVDVEQRQLRRDGALVDVSNRYFDALTLLLSEAGGLVSKDRFMDEVWRGVPVTDEALTQCIKSLRRHLDDDAARPLYIETVPKHGYRFVASVEQVPAASEEARDPSAAVFDLDAIHDIELTMDAAAWARGRRRSAWSVGGV